MNTIKDYTWNYYLYVVINISTEKMYETEDLDDARSTYHEWLELFPGDKIIIQQQHNVARRIL